MRKGSSNLVARFQTIFEINRPRIFTDIHGSNLLFPCFIRVNPRNPWQLFCQRPAANDQRRFHLVRSRVAPQFVSDDHRFGDLPHRFAGLPALALQG